MGWQEHVLERVTGPDLLALAQRTIADIPEMAAAFTDSDLQQLLHGFAQLLEEALRGTGDATRRLFLETAIPGLVAAGQKPLTLVRSTGTFAVLVTTAATEDLDPDARDTATAWLATFFGEYLRDVAAAALQAEGSHG